MRAQAAMCSGWWSSGACTTSVLGLLGSAKDNPQFRLRYEQLLSFACVWKHLDHSQRMMVSKTWERIKEKSGSTRHRWRAVRGHIAATLVVLLDVSWEPNSPVFWCAGARELRIDDDEFPSALWEQLQDTCSALSWQQAARHCMGTGLEGGADFTAVKRVLAKLQKDGEAEAAGTLRNVITA
eukprot:9466941-Pyramimonas_sp.AAC.1